MSVIITTGDGVLSQVTAEVPSEATVSLEHSEPTLFIS